MKKILLLFLLLATISVHSQTVLLKVDRKTERVASERGQNLKRFTHFYLRAGMLASEDKPGARIIYGSSVNLALGLRNKFKIGSVYSLGYEIETEYTDYKFKQEEGKIVPDTIINQMGRLDFYSLALGFYNRINFDPGRGNFMGTYLDLGIKGEYHFSIKSITKNGLPDGEQLKTTTRQLNYVYNTNAHVYARLGFSHFSFYASYRLLDVFKPDYNFPDVPTVVAGFELGLY
jgi:hypothetical protein